MKNICWPGSDLLYITAVGKLKTDFACMMSGHVVMLETACCLLAGHDDSKALKKPKSYREIDPTLGAEDHEMHAPGRLAAEPTGQSRCFRRLTTCFQSCNNNHHA